MRKPPVSDQSGITMPQQLKLRAASLYKLDMRRSLILHLQETKAIWKGSQLLVSFARASKGTLVTKGMITRIVGTIQTCYTSDGKALPNFPQGTHYQEEGCKPIHWWPLHDRDLATPTLLHETLLPGHPDKQGSVGGAECCSTCLPVQPHFNPTYPGA